MTTWYNVANYSLIIQPTEVVRETEKFLVIKRLRYGKETEQRLLKHSGYDKFFPSFEEAKQHLIERLNYKIDYALKEIKQAQNDLVLVQKMEKS